MGGGGYMVDIIVRNHDTVQHFYESFKSFSAILPFSNADT